MIYKLKVKKVQLINKANGIGDLPRRRDD